MRSPSDLAPSPRGKKKPHAMKDSGLAAHPLGKREPAGQQESLHAVESKKLAGCPLG